jgi:hypothetical protein
LVETQQVTLALGGHEIEIVHVWKPAHRSEFLTHSGTSGSNVYLYQYRSGVGCGV